MSSDIIERVLRFCRYWVDFVGPRRLFAAVGTAALCAAGAWFVLKPTPVPVEFVAPRATVPTSASVVTTQVKVHVTGAVRTPGVYEVPSQSRIVDVLALAGGATSGADLERINLAQTVVDAEQIHIPRRTPAAPRVTVAPRLRPRARPSSTVTTTGSPSTVNINTATPAQLESLTGVGPSLAKAIVTHRTQKGPFTKVDDLLNVPGIGPSKLAAMRNEVTVS